MKVARKAGRRYPVRVRTLPVSAALLLCLSCVDKAPPPGAAGPVEAVQDLAAALARGDEDAAWSLLSSRTQRAADALAKKAHDAAGAAGPESGRQMLFSSALRGAAVQARELFASATAAEVETSEDGGARRTFHVVRESGLWKVDLPLDKP